MRPCKHQVRPSGTFGFALAGAKNIFEHLAGGFWFQKTTSGSGGGHPSTRSALLVLHWRRQFFSNARVQCRWTWNVSEGTVGQWAAAAIRAYGQFFPGHLVLQCRKLLFEPKRSNCTDSSPYNGLNSTALSDLKTSHEQACSQTCLCVKAFLVLLAISLKTPGVAVRGGRPQLSKEV